MSIKQLLQKHAHKMVGGSHEAQADLNFVQKMLLLLLFFNNIQLSVTVVFPSGTFWCTKLVSVTSDNKKVCFSLVPLQL